MANKLNSKGEGIIRWMREKQNDQIFHVEMCVESQKQKQNEWIFAKSKKKKNTLKVGKGKSL